MAFDEFIFFNFLCSELTIVNSTFSLFFLVLKSIEMLLPINFFFLISNKDLLKSKRERHSSTQGVYRGEHIKSEHYINQVNPK